MFARRGYGELSVPKIQIKDMPEFSSLAELWTNVFGPLNETSNRRSTEFAKGDVFNYRINGEVYSLRLTEDRGLGNIQSPQFEIGKGIYGSRGYNKIGQFVLSHDDALYVDKGRFSKEYKKAGSEDMARIMPLSKARSVAVSTSAASEASSETASVSTDDVELEDDLDGSVYSEAQTVVRPPVKVEAAPASPKIGFGRRLALRAVATFSRIARRFKSGTAKYGEMEDEVDLELPNFTEEVVVEPAVIPSRLYSLFSNALARSKKERDNLDFNIDNDESSIKRLRVRDVRIVPGSDSISGTGDFDVEFTFDREDGSEARKFILRNNAGTSAVDDASNIILFEVGADGSLKRVNLESEDLGLFSHVVNSLQDDDLFKPVDKDVADDDVIAAPREYSFASESPDLVRVKMPAAAPVKFDDIFDNPFEAEAGSVSLAATSGFASPDNDLENPFSERGYEVHMKTAAARAPAAAASPVVVPAIPAVREFGKGGRGNLKDEAARMDLVTADSSRGWDGSDREFVTHRAEVLAARAGQGKMDFVHNVGTSEAERREAVLKRVRGGELVPAKEFSHLFEGQDETPLTVARQAAAEAAAEAAKVPIVLRGDYDKKQKVALQYYENCDTIYSLYTLLSTRDETSLPELDGNAATDVRVSGRKLEFRFGGSNYTITDGVEIKKGGNLFALNPKDSKALRGLRDYAVLLQQGEVVSAAPVVEAADLVAPAVKPELEEPIFTLVSAVVPATTIAPVACTDLRGRVIDGGAMVVEVAGRAKTVHAGSARGTGFVIGGLTAEESASLGGSDSKGVYVGSSAVQEIMIKREVDVLQSAIAHAMSGKDYQRADGGVIAGFSGGLTREASCALMRAAFTAAELAGGLSAECEKGELCLDSNGNFLGWMKNGVVSDVEGFGVSKDLVAQKCKTGAELAAAMFDKTLGKEVLEAAGIDKNNIGVYCKRMSAVVQECAAARNLKTSREGSDVGGRLTYFKPESIERATQDVVLDDKAFSKGGESR